MKPKHTMRPKPPQPVKKMMCYFPATMAERLRVIAFNHRVSQAEIIRNAVEKELRRLEK